MALTAENKKQLLAGGLFVVLGAVLYYQFFSGSEATAPPAYTPRPSPTPAVVRGPGASRGELEVVTGPLPIGLLTGRAGAEGGTGRNIFVYPTPTPTPTPAPTPPPPPPPPPPITIAGVNPSGVIARTGDFNLTIAGGKIPPDAVAYINGRNYPTTFLNETQVRVAVPGDAIGAPGNLRVEIKSSGDPGLYSNAMSLNVAPPPTPPYAYVAMIIDAKGVESVILKSQSDGRLVTLKQGEKVDNWQLVKIGAEKVEMLDTNYNIPHSINFTSEGS